MLGLCGKDGVTPPLWADSGSAIRTCVTVLTDEGGATELVQEPFPVDPACEKPIRDLFSQNIKDCDGLIILGTVPPLATQTISMQIL